MKNEAKQFMRRQSVVPKLKAKSTMFNQLTNNNVKRKTNIEKMEIPNLF